MKIIQLPDVLHEYLVHLIEAHAAQGIHPEEGLALYQLWDSAVVRVTTIPDAEMQKMAAAGSLDGQSPPVPGVESEHDPSSPFRPVECDICFDEEGSQTCLRPAHHQTTKNPA